MNPSAPNTFCPSKPAHNTSRLTRALLSAGMVLMSLSLAHAQSGSFDRGGAGAGRQMSGGAPVSGSGPMSGGGPVSGTGPGDAQRPLSGFGNQGVSGVQPNPNDPGGRGPDGKPKDPYSKAAQKAKDGKAKDSKTGMSATPGGPGLACMNCGRILQVKPIRVKAQPSWMLRSENPQPQTPDSKNTELPNRGQGSTIGISGNRTILNPEFNGAQFGKRVFEVTLMMENGLTQKVNLDMMPAYNIGSQVRIVGNRLMPR